MEKQIENLLKQFLEVPSAKNYALLDHVLLKYQEMYMDSFGNA